MPRFYLPFFFSGFAALLYQIVWQRALFAIYGINIESVTVIVTAFMLGLGVGSLAGGAVSKVPGRPLLTIFACIEFGIGLYGMLSLQIFHWAGSFTIGMSTLGTGLVTFVLVLVPTILMGSTLPLLVADGVGRSGNVGRSVAVLYFVNTFGSAAAALVAVCYLLGRLGQTRTVMLAAAINVLVGASVLLTRPPSKRVA